MAKSLVAAMVLLFVAIPTLATAAPDCVCRADGRFFHQGELFCLHTPQGERLARCEMSQNVTTWRVIEKGCPTVEFTPLPSSATVVAKLGPTVSSPIPEN